MEQVILLITATVLAGMGGTGLGGLIGALFKRDSVKTVSLLLSFAGGVMISIVCFDLLITALETGVGVYVVSAAVVLGGIMVFLPNLLIDRTTNKEVRHIDENHPATADDLDEIIHSNHLSEHLKKHDTKLSLFVAGVIMTIAIALHNFPEGMTIGASFAAHDEVFQGSVLMLAILIGLHNIPEGMAISVPLINGGIRRREAILITTLAGTPTILGALLGYFIGDVGPMGLAMSLSLASGAMFYVIFGELVPQSILMYKSKLPAVFIILGILTGLIVINM